MGILRADRVSGLGGANAINGSVRFDQDGYIHVDAHDDWSLDGDFTIECWVKRDAPGAFADKFTIGDSKESTGLELYLGSGGAALNVYSNNGGILVAAAGSYSANVWHHLALVRIGNTIKLYVDGTVDNNTATNTATFSGDLRLGAEFYNNPATPDTRSSFYMSNFRIVKGTALYTANFTVPAQRLENISGTAILCCQSPGDVTQEATGKTIVPTSTNLNSSVPYATHIAPDKGEDHGTTFTDNTKFDTLSYLVPPGGTTTQRGRGRVLFGGGSPTDNAIQYFNIQSQGNAQDFGDLSGNRYETECAASSTRGIWGGGYTEDTSPNTKVDIIEYVTIATTSNTTDFGNLTVARGHLAGVCNSTRGVFANGTTNPSPHPVVNTIDYITIATAGNATDFGDTTTASKPMGGGRSSTTRGVFTLGNAPSAVNTMEYVTIASTGNSADFGDAIVSGWGRGAGNVSSGTRGILGGGNPALNTIEYITIASLGNGTDFGDLVVGRRSAYSAGSTIRGVFGGGKTPTQLNSIEYITIASTGNAQDFGDLINSKSFASGLSDCHGGLS